MRNVKMISFTPRQLVCGSMLRNFIGQHVSIHVNVQEADRGANVINGKTTDDINITISLSEPLNAPVKGWIEVIGTPTGPNAIRNKEVRSIAIHCEITAFFTVFHAQFMLIDWFCHFSLQIIIFPEEEGNEPYNKNAHVQMVTFWNNCKDILNAE